MDACDRVVIVQRYIPHYRIALFQRLTAENQDIMIEVLHGGDLGERYVNLPEGFVNRQYRNVIISFFGYNIVLQPGVLVNVLLHPPQLLILEGTFGVLTNMLLLILRSIRNEKTIYWTAGWDNPLVSGKRHWLKTKIIAQLLSWSDGAIVYGSEAGKYLTRHGLGGEKIWIAQNTIDVEGIAARQEYWHQQAKFIKQRMGLDRKQIILYVGGISALKHVDNLVDACAQLQAELDDIACVIVGDGANLAALKQRAAQKRIKDIHFVGKVVEGVEVYFALGDVFVMPGSGGLAINQAMALGLPVVAAAADGTQKDLIVPGVNGYLVEAGNLDELKGCLKELISDPARAAQMGQKSLEIVLQRASFAMMIAGYSSAIRAALKRSGKRIGEEVAR